jgi:integrase
MMNNNGWQAARKAASALYKAKLDKGCPQGFCTLHVHDLRHTFGRRLRAAGVSNETRQDLLGHKNGNITTHYSAAELCELLRAVKLIESGASAPLLRRVA